jgi:hypothetical protein
MGDTVSRGWIVTGMTDDDVRILVWDQAFTSFLALQPWQQEVTRKPITQEVDKRKHDVMQCQWAEC